VIERLNDAYRGLGDVVLNSFTNPSKAISPRRALALAAALKSGAFRDGAEASLVTCGTPDVFAVLALKEKTR
jgi:hypothetical protein